MYKCKAAYRAGYLAGRELVDVEAKRLVVRF